jgi:hypothetical protein
MLFSIFGGSNPTQGYSINFDVKNNDFGTCDPTLGEYVVLWDFNITPPSTLVNGSVILIEYSIDSGSNWNTIASGVNTNLGSYAGNVGYDLTTVWFRCTATYNGFIYAGSPEILTPPYSCI